MSKVRPPYPAAFRQQTVELVQAGRSPVRSVSPWVDRTVIDAGKSLPGKDCLTTAERSELMRLRKQLRQVQMARDIRTNIVAASAGW